MNEANNNGATTEQSDMAAFERVYRHMISETVSDDEHARDDAKVFAQMTELGVLPQGMDLAREIPDRLLRDRILHAIGHLRQGIEILDPLSFDAALMTMALFVRRFVVEAAQTGQKESAR